MDLKDVKIEIIPRYLEGGMRPVQLDKGVRATHLPTKLYVEVDHHRTMHKNKKEALERLERVVDRGNVLPTFHQEEVLNEEISTP